MDFLKNASYQCFLMCVLRTPTGPQLNLCQFQILVIFLLNIIFYHIWKKCYFANNGFLALHFVDKIICLEYYCFLLLLSFVVFTGLTWPRCEIKDIILQQVAASQKLGGGAMLQMSCALDTGVSAMNFSPYVLSSLACWLLSLLLTVNKGSW